MTVPDWLDWLDVWESAPFAFRAVFAPFVADPDRRPLATIVWLSALGALGVGVWALATERVLLGSIRLATGIVLFWIAGTLAE